MPSVHDVRALSDPHPCAYLDQRSRRKALNSVGGKLQIRRRSCPRLRDRRRRVRADPVLRPRRPHTYFHSAALVGPTRRRFMGSTVCGGCVCGGLPTASMPTVPRETSVRAASAETPDSEPAVRRVMERATTASPRAACSTSGPGEEPPSASAMSFAPAAVARGQRRGCGTCQDSSRSDVPRETMIASISDADRTSDPARCVTDFSQSARAMP